MGVRGVPDPPAGQESDGGGFFAPKPDPESDGEEEINKGDALVTFKEFQVLENKVDELILLQKEIAANLLEMNRVRQTAAKKKKGGRKGGSRKN